MEVSGSVSRPASESVWPLRNKMPPAELRTTVPGPYCDVRIIIRHLAAWLRHTASESQITL